jgi:hypothetical protein
VKARTLAPLAVAAVAAAGLVWWRRRSASAPRPAVQLGLSDGVVRTLDPSDPSTAELETLAAGVRDSLTGGA